MPRGRWEAGKSVKAAIQARASSWSSGVVREEIAGGRGRVGAEEW